MHTKRKYSLPRIISALIASNWSRITFFILANLLTSISSRFLECDDSTSVSSTSIKWFNDMHKLNVSPSAEQILFNLTDGIASLTSIQKRRLDLLLLVMKHYVYSCKVFSRNLNISELQTKVQMQWKIEHCSLTWFGNFPHPLST